MARRSYLRVALLAVLVVGLAPSLGHGTARAALLQDVFRAGDGTAYQVIRAEERFRVTTISGGASGVGFCFQSGGGVGQPASAVSGADPAAFQALHPYAQILRTGLLTLNDINAISFDQSFGGRVTLGTGGAAVTVCHDALDCGGLVAAPLVPLDSSDLIPPACIASGVSAQCDAAIVRNVFAFGLAASGNPPLCNNPAAVSVDSTICAPQPPDGFVLEAGQAIVVVYDTSLAGVPFTAGFGAFRISENVSTPPCFSTNLVLFSAAGAELAPALPLPTATPSGASPTPTDTPTNSPTPRDTRTARPTRTPRETRTPRTPLPTNTERPTRTPIAERSPLPTNTPRPTRTPIQLRMHRPTRTPIETRTLEPTLMMRPTRTPLEPVKTRVPRPTRTPIALR